MRVELASPRTSVRSLEEIELTATITNDADQPATLDTRYLGIAALVFEVRDPRGENVPMMPPPVPYEDDGVTGREELGAGESTRFSFQGTSFFGFPLDPGDYTFRYRFDAVNVPPAQDWEGALRSGELVLTVQP